MNDIINITSGVDIENTNQGVRIVFMAHSSDLSDSDLSKQTLEIALAEIVNREFAEALARKSNQGSALDRPSLGIKCEDNKAEEAVEIPNILAFAKRGDNQPNEEGI